MRARDIIEGIVGLQPRPKDVSDKRLRGLVKDFHKAGYTKKQAYGYIKSVIFLSKATDIAEV